MSFEDPLLGLAIILVMGIVGGELVGRLHLPKVTGWIGTGIALRAMQMPGMEDLTRYSAFANFVLGYIAFTLGATLHLASLRNARLRLGLLMLAELVCTPAVVVLGMVFVAGMDARAALLLGAIAIAGAPGTTALVAQEARAKGILTRTLVAAVALIDMVAVGGFVFAASFIPGGAENTWQHAFASVGAEFAATAGVGVGCSVVALLLTRFVVGPAFLGPVMVAVILGAWGAARGFNCSGILACTFAGIAASNLRHDVIRATEAYLSTFGGALFAGFYTLAGMRLDFSLVLPMIGMVIIYFAARVVGKSIGAFAAMSIAGATWPVRKYLGPALLPHGGVAVGLILVVQSDPRLAEWGQTVTTVGLAALAINQLLGPSVTRYCLQAAGEANMDRARLLDFLDEHHITVDLTGKSKDEIIRGLAAQLYGVERFSISQEEFIELAIQRENEESTCLGEGLMIPHVILPEGAEMQGMLGISTRGLQLQAPDGKPVHAVLLLATPQTDRKRHLEVLAAFARAITQNGSLREQLYHARSAAHAYDVLHADEAQDMNYFLEDAMERAGVFEKG
ncbi:MAG: PTS sugar transporter subunit IIA [Planctomycetales bacterium]|nr:PTS sugar transporter subunit IIA [Planctomycetales bacterium]